MKNKFIYFDNASTTHLSKNVLEIINFSYINFWGNVSSKYNFGIECSLKLEKIRNKIANIFNADNEDIVFTSGSSESISIAFNGVFDKFKPQSITISTIEHQASIIAANKLERKGWNLNKWPVDAEGILILEYIDKFINNNTTFVSLIWGQSEIGTIQPVQEIGKRCSELGVLFHVDGTQILSNGIFNWNKLNCDLLSLSAHKFGGPKGIGILLTNKNSRKVLTNRDISISHEYSIRQGTQSLPLIMGLYQSLKNIKGRIIFTKNSINFKYNKTIKLRNYFIDKIKNNNFFEITGSLENRLPNHISFILFNKDFMPIEAYKIVNYMSDNDISISSGSACSSSNKKHSSVLENIGLNKHKLLSNIRLSFNNENTTQELDKFYCLILKCIEIF